MHTAHRSYMKKGFKDKCSIYSGVIIEVTERPNAASLHKLQNVLYQPVFPNYKTSYISQSSQVTKRLISASLPKLQNVLYQPVFTSYRTTYSSQS